MLKYMFWLDGKCSADYGIYLQSPITFTEAQPNYTSKTVPGRNGTIIIWDGSYANVTGTAKCFVMKHDRAGLALEKAAEFFCGNLGYLRLETEYEPDVYRMACVKNSPGNDIRLGHVAPFSVSLDCKPQKFLKDGEIEITLSSSGSTINNPTSQKALPLITVYGSGASTLTVNDTTVTISNFSTSCVLNCDTEDAYSGSTNLNNYVTASEYPVLTKGANTVSWTGGITSVKITPNWWNL